MEYNFDCLLLASGGMDSTVLAYQLAKENKNAKLVVVGSRWYNLIAKDEYFKKLIEESRGYEDRIVFTGYVFPEDMPAIYTLGDVLVIPSMWEEPFGVVALEGMAMKVPIIATNSGGLVEVLSNKTAIIVDKQKNVVENLYNAMNDMFINDKKRESFVKEACTEVTMREEYDKINYYNEFSKRIKNDVKR